ncbi:MAG: FdhF/YdeP family oxidoreductase [Bacteroidota bacterium]
MKKPTYPVEKEEDVRIEAPTEVAAGATAVASALRHGLTEMTVSSCSKSFLNLNQTKGFDCPSCAWPDPDPSDRSGVAEYCENGAKAVAEEATSKRVDIDFWAKHSVEELMSWSEYKLGKAGRITHPMILRPGQTHYEPISWDDSFALIGQHLKALDDPNEAIFYTSGRASNEAAFLYQLFSRIYGTNNLPDCANLCHEASGVAMSEAIGIGKGTVKLEDFYATDLVIVIGQNPGTNHPRMLSAMQKAKRTGAKIIGINPLPETGLKSFKNPQEIQGWIGKATPLSDLFLQVRLNQDMALLKAILLELYRRETAQPGSTFDQEFIQNHTHGYAEFIEDLQTHDLDSLAEACGIPVAQIVEATDIIQASRKMIICWAMGITQHRNSVATIREIVNLLLVKGSIGKAGAGACPVRGHSNVQGDRTVGIWDKIKPAFAEKLKARFGFDPPMENGYNAVEAIHAMHEGKAKVYISLGGNLLLAGPDTEYMAKGMRRCKLTVMVSTKPNRSHLVTGKIALILPCLGRTERDIQASGPQFYTVENSMGIVHNSKGVLPPASPHLLSEPAIVARMAEASVGNLPKLNWSKMAANYDNIRDAIEACIPGFDDYNRRVRDDAGFYLPNAAREGRFKTATGKANFFVAELPKWELSEGQFLMTTVRSHDQFNTTIYGNNDRYRGVFNGRRIVFMHADDIQKEGFQDGELVDLFSHYDGIERSAPRFRIVAYDIPTRCVATYFPEANPLIPIDRFGLKSHTPISKSVVISMRKSSAQE